MNRLLMPIKREFWEYRGSFIRLPAITAIVISLLMASALAIYASNIFDFVIDGDSISFSHNQSDEHSHMSLSIETEDATATHREALLDARKDLQEARDGLQKAKSGKIVNSVQREFDKEIAKIDQQIAKLDGNDAQMAMPVAPAEPAAPQAPEASVDQGDIRQFPSQVIVIEGDNADRYSKEFTDENIDEINDAIQVFFMLFSGLMLMITLFYLLSSLYTDRKDNSVLFWKSMPISETQNVLTKLTVGIFILPTIAVVSALLVSCVFVLLSMIYVANYSTYTSAWELWSGVNLFSFALKHLVISYGAALWSLPLFAWLVIASAGAKRSPFLLATLPPAVIVLAEKIVFDSSWALQLLADRAPGLSFTKETHVSYNVIEHAGIGNVVQFIGSPGLWLGLFVAAGLVYATIWLRNHRYEI